MTIKRYQITCKAYDKRGRLISQATNSYTKTHPIQSHFASLVGEPYKKVLHAEIHALIRAGTKTVHTLKIQNKNGSSLPHPCKICMKAIEVYKVKRIVLE